MARRPLPPRAYRGTRPTEDGGIPTTVRDIEGSLPPWYNKPGQLRQEYLISAALQIASVPGEVLQATVRPPVPVDPFPPKYGYGNDALTIEDILLTNRMNPSYRSWVSGGGIMLQRSSLTDDQWSGSSRNSMMSANPMG